MALLFGVFFFFVFLFFFLLLLFCFCIFPDGFVVLVLFDSVVTVFFCYLLFLFV